MPGAAAKHRSGTPLPGDRPRVLIVDDHALMLEYAARTLEAEFVIAGRLRDVQSLMNQWPPTRSAAH